MNESSNQDTRGRRIRNALLASVFTLGIAGAMGTGALISDSHVARAEAVKIAEPAQTADFTDVAEKVLPAVVSVQVKTEVAAVSNRNPMQGFEDLPPDHPLNEFFRRFGGPGFGGEGDGTEPYQPRRGESQGSGFFISG